jgi:archaellum biogenesis ATPase FlaH
MTTVNEFIKQMKSLFSDIEYRATSKDGRVFKSQGWDKANNRIQIRLRDKKNKSNLKLP